MGSPEKALADQIIDIPATQNGEKPEKWGMLPDLPGFCMISAQCRHFNTKGQRREGRKVIRQGAFAQQRTGRVPDHSPLGPSFGALLRERTLHPC